MFRALLILALFLPTGHAMAQSALATWNPVTEDINDQPESISGYHIYYGNSDGGPYDQGFSTPNVTQTQVDDLVNGDTYYFVVQAVDQAGNPSANSNQAEYTVPYEDCDNLADDDHDGLTDCQDTECDAVPERCDGFDNDCAGGVDDLTGDDCPLTVGVCAGSTRPCGGAAGWQDCTADTYGDDYEADEASCDALDNDCDDETDEDLDAPLCSEQLGVCAGARRPCEGAGGFGTCDADEYGADYQAVETECDNLDNDCDGSTDEDCPCTPDDTRVCSSNVGECTEGVQVCDQNGAWGACSGDLPGTEECDGLDNDCDDTTDNNLTPPACALQEGVCAGSEQTCGGASGWQACTASEYGNDYEAEEATCDALDNDCDSVTDEDDVCSGQDGGPDGGPDGGEDGGQDGGQDAGADSTGSDSGTEEPLVKGGCSCSTRSASRTPLIVLLGLFVFLGVTRRRRRR